MYDKIIANSKLQGNYIFIRIYLSIWVITDREILLHFPAWQMGAWIYVHMYPDVCTDIVHIYLLSTHLYFYTRTCEVGAHTYILVISHTLGSQDRCIFPHIISAGRAIL